MSAQVLTMPAAPMPSHRAMRGPQHTYRPTPTPNARAYIPRRRNALIPLPLLPAPPPHAIIKSVAVIHPSQIPANYGNQNQSNQGPHSGNTRNGQRRRSSGGVKGNNNMALDISQNSGPNNNAAANVPFPKSQSPTSPTSSHQLPPRSRGGPRRRSAGFAPGSFSNNSNSINGRQAATPPRPLSSPGSTYVVTVRIPPTPAFTPPPQPGTPLPSRQVSLVPGVRPIPSIRRAIPDIPAVPPKPAYNRPRISSPLASIEDAMDIDKAPTPVYGTALHPRSFPRPRNKLNVPGTKGKPPSLVLRKCAILSASGPEKGRRIWCLGVRLAMEIWEAEECLKVQEQTEMEIATAPPSSETWSEVVPVEDL